MANAPTVARVTPDWRAAVLAGLVSGAVFLALEMVMVPVFLDGSPWGPLRMMAAIVLGQGVLPVPGQMPAPPDAGVLMAALTVHTGLSILYAVILSAIVSRMSAGGALVTGAAFGVLLYIVNFYGFTALFPWFAMARNWVSIVAHAVFGLAAAWAYVALARHRATNLA